MSLVECTGSLCAQIVQVSRVAEVRGGTRRRYRGKKWRFGSFVVGIAGPGAWNSRRAEVSSKVHVVRSMS